MFNLFSLFHRKASGFFAKLKVAEREIRCIVTNNHVLPTKELASGTHAIFFYEGENPGQQVKLDPNKLFHTDKVRLPGFVFKCLG